MIIKDYLLACPKKTFERKYLNSLNADSEDFARYERARCIRHLSIYSLITSHKERKDGTKWSNKKSPKKVWSKKPHC